MPTFHDLLQDLTRQLQQEYTDPVLSQQSARWVLEAITGQKEAELVAHENIYLTAAQQKKLDMWLNKIINEHMPLSYLLGFVPFNDVEILVRQPVLIPRPETEEWCVALIEKLQRIKNKAITILDIGTGSGCVAVALAKALPEAIVYGTDISSDAVELAKANADHNNIKNVTFLVSDLFENIPTSTLFDLIVANPPYVSVPEWQKLDPSVKQWEDKRALVAEDHGLALIKKIIEGARKYLKKNNEFQRLGLPNIVIEIGYAQGEETKKFFETHGYQKVIIVKDLEGKDRTVQARG
ncbi:MAG TPA: peptide chain release factor N(5)-glutamine methyltransferase [Candidatus Babeliales bacterium]|nr:peptide chain release factor N(5)-glutamine methyltransferase [Candidatus Babeliales bacterium]